jgi:hypothetical protein
MKRTMLAGRFSRLVVFACLSASCAASSGGSQTRAPGRAASWERVVDDAFENKGIARLEQLGRRWALTVLCSGTHTTYLADTTVNPADFAKGYVQARYRYVERTVPDPKCVRAPCGPVIERLVALDKVTPVAATPEQAAEIARDCKAPL